MALTEILIAQRQEDRKPGGDGLVVHRVDILDFEIEKDTTRATASPVRDRLVVALEDRQIDGRLVRRLQMRVPVRLEQRPEREVADIERSRGGHILDHEDGIGAGDFHASLLHFRNILSVCNSSNKQADRMQQQTPRRSNSERSADMRANLLATARRLFVAQGYAATSTPAIVEGARVTRGALYHHFPDKQTIFRAVVEAESATVAEALEAADAPTMSALERLLAGAAAYVRAMQAEGRTRLLLVDGPAVLGRQAMRQIDGQHGDASLKIGLEEAMAEGALVQLPIEPLASLLSALFERAALNVAEGAAPADVLTVLTQMLFGLSPLGQKDAVRDSARPSEQFGVLS
mgnify:CR=1 FL=1